MKKNEITKYNDSLIKRVDSYINITNKLLNTQINHVSESSLKNKILAMQKLKKLVNEARDWHVQQENINRQQLNKEAGHDRENTFIDGQQ